MSRFLPRKIAGPYFKESMRPYFPVGGVGLVALDFHGKTTPLSGTYSGHYSSQ